MKNNFCHVLFILIISLKYMRSKYCNVLQVQNQEVQGLSEGMAKVNPFERALFFTKSGFSGVFWDEK